MPTSIVIIGAGPGGEAAAKRAVAKGAQVTVIEKRDLGGLCLNRGCIPSKTLLEAGRLLSQVRAAGDYVKGQNGLHVQWDLLQKKKEAVVTALRTSVGQNFKRLGVRLVQGDAAFLDGKTLSVKTAAGEERLAFDRAVIATGSHPFFPPPFDAFRDKLLDSDRALELPRLPARMIIVGGGAVGCEFACLFRELGVDVTIVEMTETLLPGEDAAVVRTLRQVFEKRGIAVRTGATVKALAGGKVWKAGLSDGSTLEAEEVLVCVGRRPGVGALALEKAGVKEEKGRIAVNEFLQTSVPSIYAVGDVNGLSLLAHAAAVQGEVAADHALGEKRAYPHHLVPRCLYTWPEVASVGEWAHSAEAKGSAVKTQRFFFQASAKAMASNEPEGFIQIVSEKDGGRLLGAQIIGPHATELIHIFAVALQGGLTVDQLRGVIYAHPTLAEGVKEALSR